MNNFFNPRKVLLIAPPTSTFRSPEEHLGIAYLASEANEHGHKVQILDSWLERLGPDKVVKKALRKKYDVIGISPSMDSDLATIQIACLLRKNGYGGLIVLGGYNATFEFRKYFIESNNQIDIVFRGEADDIFPIFLDYLARNKDWANLPGIVYREGKGFVVNRPAPQINDLDRLPFPQRSTIKYALKYNTPIHVSDSRDCYNRCSFCSIGAFYNIAQGGLRWRSRSPESIACELEYLQSLGVTMVKFLGDSFFGGADWKKRTYRLCEEIEKRKIRIRFRISTRANNVDEKLYLRLKKCGLFAVSLGAESGVQRKLDDYEKNTTVEQNIKAVKILQKLGIYVQMGFILFDPWVTIKELNQEYLFLNKTKWCVTKGVCSSLFAPDGTKITMQIRKTCGFIAKKGSNNIYLIQDIKARKVYQFLKKWSERSIDLYDVIIDPISAPKVVLDSLLKKFYDIYAECRRKDMEVFKHLIQMVDTGKSDDVINCFIDGMLAKNEGFYRSTERKVKKLYRQANLVYYIKPNKYL